MRPYGYEVDRTTLRPHEADVIREAADRLIEGESLRSVAADLNARGERTSAGNEWQSPVLRRVVMSPRVAGLRAAKHGQYDETDWPAIIDRPSWEKLVDLLGHEGRRNGTASTTRTYLLTGGLVRCALCGSALIARPQGGQRNYVCSSSPPHNGCGRIRVVAPEVENEVVERALGRLLRPGAQEKMKATFERAQTAAGDAEGEIERQEERLKQLGRDYADGHLGGTDARAARERINTKIAEARHALRVRDNLTRSSVLDAENLVEWWEGASLDQQRALLEVMLDRVEVTSVIRRGSRIFDPNRVKIYWRR